MSTGNVNADKGNIKAAGQAGLSYNVEKSLAAKAGGSTNESHAAAPLDEVLALKARCFMALSKLLKQRHADSVFNLAFDDAIGEGNVES